jgi:hypothetical protein
LPRRKPITDRDIRAREQFGFGPIPFNAKNEVSRQSLGDSWDFSDALDCLGTRDVDGRRECQKEMTEICRLHELIRFGERQETPARKAEALHKARRQCKQRERAFKQIKESDELQAKGDIKGAQQIHHDAVRILRRPWLPLALEQEVGRLAQSEGLSLIEAYVELEKRYRRRSVPGRRESHTLAQTIRRLQDLASRADGTLTWRNQTIPPRLISFLQAALMAAGIRYPSYDHNPSKFRKLMGKVRERPT